MGLGEKISEKDEILVWVKDTWGNYGQHANLYTFVIDIETKKQEPIFKLVNIRYENDDSRKNFHRYMFVTKKELAKLDGKIIKMVSDYKSSSRREINVKYFRIENGEMVRLDAKNNLRDEKGFYDLLSFNGTTIKVRKDTIEVVE